MPGLLRDHVWTDLPHALVTSIMGRNWCLPAKPWFSLLRHFLKVEALLYLYLPFQPRLWTLQEMRFMWRFVPDRHGIGP